MENFVTLLAAGGIGGAIVGLIQAIISPIVIHFLDQKKEDRAEKRKKIEKILDIRAKYLEYSSVVNLYIVGIFGILKHPNSKELTQMAENSQKKLSGAQIDEIRRYQPLLPKKISDLFKDYQDTFVTISTGAIAGVTLSNEEIARASSKLQEKSNKIIDTLDEYIRTLA